MRDNKINSVVGNQVITLQNAKDFLRVDNDLDDYIITRMIDSATKWCEEYISRDIISKNRTQYFSEVNESFRLPYAPILSVESVTAGTDNDDVTYTENGLDDIYIELSSSNTNVKVTYITEGIADELVTDAILSLVVSYYDYRADFIMGNITPIPTGVKNKLSVLRYISF